MFSVNSRFYEYREVSRFFLSRNYYRLQAKQLVHFLHIGKTGGTAIRDTLQKYSVNQKCKIYFHGHEFYLHDVPLGDKCFFFLRDPVSRVISGFYSRQRMGRPRYNLPWSSVETVAFRNFNTPNDLASALSSSDLELRTRAEQAMQGIAHVRSSYWDWFGNEAYFLSRLDDILFIGFQEQLSDDFDQLKQLLCLPESVRLPEDGKQAHRNPQTLDKHLDDEARRNLMIWYACDYEFLELCRDKAARSNGISNFIC